jgi:hypothetical protein
MKEAFCCQSGKTSNSRNKNPKHDAIDERGVPTVRQNEREGLKDRNKGHKVRFRLNPGERATDEKKSQTTTTTEKKTPTIGRSYADIVRRATRKVGVVSKIV